MKDSRSGGKVFKTYSEQIDLLTDRGMVVEDRELALKTLQRVNYYRLSGYWYPFRVINKSDSTRRKDNFYPGTTFSDVVALYEFDARLRIVVLEVLAPLELAFRSLLGYQLGSVDRYAHLEPGSLGSLARQARSTAPSPTYEKWIRRYKNEQNQSHEDFVAHHNQKYGGRLPIWAAVEILDWGMLTYLYSMSPEKVRDAVALECGISAPQLQSWLKALNIVRNYAAHHGRMFNRVYDLKPKLPRQSSELDIARGQTNRLFGQLTTVQHLLRYFGFSRTHLLPELMETYPEVTFVPLSHTGTPDDWRKSPLWTP